MTIAEVMESLHSVASEQTRKTYRRHGSEDCIGVSMAFLEKLRKQLKRNQGLAVELWATGKMEARYLAAMIADPAAMSSADLDSWVIGAKDRTVLNAVTRYVLAKSPIGLGRAEAWIDSDDELTILTGWHTLALFAQAENDLSDDFFAQLIERIETRIRSAPNFAQYGMNSALIAIGIRNEALGKLATAAAKRIGPVDVDHGDTSCKTPDAAEYIRKGSAHRSAKRRASGKRPRSRRWAEQ